MRPSKFTEEQIVALLREAEKGEQTIQALAKDRGITEQTFYRWRKKYGSVEVQDLKRMRELEKENSRLKRIVGELSLDVAALKELNAKKW